MYPRCGVKELARAIGRSEGCCISLFQLISVLTIFFLEKLILQSHNAVMDAHVERRRSKTGMVGRRLAVPG